MRLTRVAPLSVAKVAFVLYGLMGLIFGVIVAVASLIGATIGMSQHDGSAFFGAIFGVGAIVLLPILYGVLGSVVALTMAAIYNLAASLMGGIELTFEPVGPAQ